MNATRSGTQRTLIPAALVLGLTTLLPLAVRASPLSDLATDVEPGEFVELEIEGSVTTCDAMVPPGEGPLGNILEFTDEALWEATDREIYIMGERRPYAAGDKQFVKYTEATNSWTILERPPFNTGFHGYDHGAIDPVRRTYYRAMTGTAGRVWAMEISSGEWEELPSVPAQVGQIIAMDFFPEIDGLAYFHSYYDRGSITNYLKYPPDEGVWQRTSLDAPFGTQSAFSEYSAPRRVVYFGGGHHWSNGGMIPDPTPSINESRRFYMLDENEVVTRLTDAPAYLGQGGSGPVQTIDPNTGNLVVFPGRPADHEAGTPCDEPQPIYEYNQDDDTWRETGTQELANMWCAMDTAAVPLYDYGVIFIVSVRSQTNCRVLLYRHSPGTGPGIDPKPDPDPDPTDPSTGTSAGTAAGTSGSTSGGTGDTPGTEVPNATGHSSTADAGSTGEASPEAGSGSSTGGCQCDVVPTRQKGWFWMLAGFASLVLLRRRPVAA